jgi:hypothetical protein
MPEPSPNAASSSVSQAGQHIVGRILGKYRLKEGANRPKPRRSVLGPLEVPS